MKENNEYSIWSLYDSMVQSYRSNMIASQSLLLAVAAILFEKNIYIECTVCAVALFQLWFIWSRIIFSRAIISDFHKFNALYNFNHLVDNNGNEIKDTDETSFLTEEKYIKDRTVRRKANLVLAARTGNIKLKSNCRITRVKLDIIMPVLFTIVWLSLVFVKLFDFPI